MWHFIFQIHLAAVILGKCHINKDFVIYQRKLLCVAGLAIAFSLSLFLFFPSPSFAPYSACAGCFKSASHKKSLSQWNTAIWEIIEWWLGGTNASLRNYTTISPAFTTFLKASCHPGRKAPDWRFITSLSQHGGMAASSPDATQQHTPPTAGDATAKAAASFSFSHLVVFSLLSLCSPFSSLKTLFFPSYLDSQNHRQHAHKAGKRFFIYCTEIMWQDT